MLIDILKNEFRCSEKVVRTLITFLDEGTSIPFIARYRKDETQGMNDVTLRQFHDRYTYILKLEARRKSIITSLSNIKNTSIELIKSIENTDSLIELEELYRPYKASKQTKSQVAESLGLTSLSKKLWLNSSKAQHHGIASLWLSKRNINNLSIESAVEGAYNILIDKLANNADLIKESLNSLKESGVIESKVIRGKKEKSEKYRDYWDHKEKVAKAPHHRLLAMFRGEKEKLLKINIKLEKHIHADGTPLFLNKCALQLNFDDTITPCPSSMKPFWLSLVWKEKLLKHTERKILSTLKMDAEHNAVRVFSDNLKDLLMAPPAGATPVLALDPGYKNGVKYAAIDASGEVQSTGIVFATPPANKTVESETVLVNILKRQAIKWIVTGNGTASKEADTFARNMIRKHELNCKAIISSEAGASVYSASETASKEFPNIDVSLRGAISIARRFQDPLSELVKIAPKAIGVGQYQHDIKETTLNQSLANVVEDCVNSVGVDLNLASESLLQYVSGLTPTTARNIVEYRQSNGKFKNRETLLNIRGIGDKAFKMCAGFLKINDGNEPLDNTAVHPESYSLVYTLSKNLKMPIKQIIGNSDHIARIESEYKERYKEKEYYLFKNVISELSHPFRDPRPVFKYATFSSDIKNINDLSINMKLEGVITNITSFGAFVDIGVHQDGLIHISNISNQFIKDPRQVVRVGQTVNIEVIDLDISRRRISLKKIS
ncbi:S1 RNA-binding domain-containing protein [Marinomonas mediterranea]|uniref:helix-hairpin-helix domain-containing protein n=1 Tax=Marinomonas mediterranea TaxID=119864 RepID=UPI00234B1468|nr:Tex-like N-terminal domain-containing protein [Marinomonas mediterranea]WCN12072.1 S1 RNA-binding domain-containing protein [Marinomonas mediterranea]